ncbi:MAG: HAD family hydrolase [Candidatus Sericytochromatia bacterium]|nr:HAD family hydrolase [Candidatus Sericytochromatia bacterium]
MKLAIFFDRDGTINEEVGYIRNLDDMKLIAGAGAALKSVNEAGFLAILATNQSGPARGYYDETWIEKLHERLELLLADEGARLDDIYYCPHLPDGTVPAYSGVCRCRKPEVGMLEDAANKWNLDLNRSYMIGDKATDVEAGQKAGCKTILLRSGYGAQVLAGTYQWPCTPSFIANDIFEAVAWALADAGRRLDACE